MPRRTKIARKLKYSPPLTRTTDRFVVKLMTRGKKGLAEKILRQALARAEASAGRPGLEVLDAALRNATPIIEVKPRRVVVPPTRCLSRSAASAAPRWACAGWYRRRASAAASP